MRQIKFRHWYDKSQCFVHYTFGTIMTDKSREIYEDICIDGGVWEQFTGLKDENGIEIYEGDILGEDGDDSVADIVRFGHVVLEEDNWGIPHAYMGFYIEYPDGTINSFNNGKENDESCYGCNAYAMKVIGNIHDQ